MTVCSMTIDQLIVSPLNVRQDEDAIKETRGLEESIEAHGLLLPMIAHPMSGTEVFGVLAGGRRLRAIQRLVDANRLPADWPIDVIVRNLTPVEITELSLLENLMRRDLQPWEIHAAIAKAHAQGASVTEIATNLGQTELWVARQLRLGTLVPEIRDAYASVTLTLEQAVAFAATEDHELQRAAWRWYQDAPAHLRTQVQIRSFLKVGDHELDRLLRFVGDDIYRSAGGRFELDLFADEAEQRGRVADEGKLRELVENKLAHIKQQLRIQSRRSDLRFAAEPPKAHGYPDRDLEITPGWQEDQEFCLPDGDIIATLAIDDAGEPEPRFWWASRSAKRAGEKLDRTAQKAAPAASVSDTSGFSTHGASAPAQAARAAVKDEHGLTADGLQVVRSMRRDLLRTLLIRNAANGGSLAGDYLVWAQLRSVLRDDLPRDTGSRGLASTWEDASEREPEEFARSFLTAMEAGKVWRAANETIRGATFIRYDDPEQGLEAYIAAPEEVKRLAEAVLVGHALMRSANVPGWRIAVHDCLATMANGDDATLREVWEPTDKFVGLLPRMKRLELAQPYVEPDAFRSWAKLADPVLSSATTGVLKDAGWIHPLLSFGVATEQQRDAREAAE